MGLRDWAVFVEHDPSKSDTWAQVQIPDGRREVHILFCADFEQLEPDDQRHAIVHELVHPHLARIWSTVEDGAQESLGGVALRMFLQTVRRDLEHSVDALAAIIASHMPEPPWQS
jgi:hypothetical protein